MTEPRSALAAARELLAEVNRDGPKVVTFSRGLAIGALVGAAIAGMAMLDRRRTRRAPGIERDRGVTGG
jgi:hypothetical protein